MRPITERFAGRLSTAAQRAAHFDALLAKLVVHPQTAPKRDRAILDARDGDLAGALRCRNF